MFLILFLGLVTIFPRYTFADTGSFDATNVSWSNNAVTFTVANSAPNSQPAFSDVCLKNYPYDSGNFACTQNFTVNWPNITATFTQDLINAHVIIGLNSNLWYLSNQSFDLPTYTAGNFDATNVSWSNNAVTFTVANSAPNSHPFFSDVCLGNVPSGTGHDQCTQVLDTSNWPVVTATFTANYLSGTHTLWLNSSPFWYISNQYFQFPDNVPTYGSFDATNVSWSNNAVTFTVANGMPYYHPAFSDVCLKNYPYDSGNFACTQNFTVNWPNITATFTQDLINAHVIIGLNSNPLWYLSNQSFDLYTNTSPTLAQIGNKTVDEGQQLQFTVNATDPDGDNLTYSAVNLPPGATFNPATATFSWTPGFDQAGNYPGVEFTVTDDGSPIELDTELITITVGGVNHTPIFSLIDPQAVREEEALTFTVAATDPDGDGITLSATNLPTGASFDAQTGELFWTPTLSQAGNHVVTFNATDNGTPVEIGHIDVPITVGDNPTPTEQADNLVDTVVTTYDFPTNVENSYLSNLKKVAIFIENDQIVAARNQLNAFIAKVNTDYAAGTITQAIRDNLVSLAEALLADLQ